MGNKVNDSNDKLDETRPVVESNNVVEELNDNIACTKQQHEIEDGKMAVDKIE